MRNASIQLAVGTILQKRYRIVRVIGAGGFGITYEAMDELNKIRCAIKEFAPMEIAVRTTDGRTMCPASSEKSALYEHGKQRFLEEAEILKRLQNVDTVVSITDYFLENGTCYFVMEYLDGVTLKNLLKGIGGRLPLNQALPVIYKLGMALQKVHKYCNIFHRDISPDNIIITSQGAVKLIDFGNAKSIISDGQQQLSVILKPGFAPYEQYSSSGKQGSYTDVYSLACTFYYALSGMMMPPAPERIIGATYVSLKKMGIDIPEYISDAFDRALEIQYKNRTQTMLAFLEDLRLLKKSEAMDRNNSIPNVVSKSSASKQPYLDIVEQNKKVTRYMLPQNIPVIIGRSQMQAQIVLTGDTCISKNQCEIFYDSIEQVFYIQDHSTNGTYVNGQRLVKEKIYILEENQLCSVGNQIISLKVGTLYE